MTRLARWLLRRPSAHTPSSPIMRRGFRPHLVLLEARVVPALITWTGAGTLHHWDDPNNWDTLTVPGSGDNVLFDAPPTYPYDIDIVSNSSLPGDISADTMTFDGGANVYLANGPPIVAATVTVHDASAYMWWSADIGTLVVAPTAGVPDGPLYGFAMDVKLDHDENEVPNEIGAIDWEGGFLEGFFRTADLTIGTDGPQPGMRAVVQNEGDCFWGGTDIYAQSYSGFDNLEGGAFTLGATGDFVTFPGTFGLVTANYSHFTNSGTLTEYPGGTRGFSPYTFTQTSTGVLNMDLKWVKDQNYDHIDAGASLAGTLNVNLLPGHVLLPGDVFPIFPYGRTGTFDTVNLPDPGDGLYLTLEYDYAGAGVAVVVHGAPPDDTPNDCGCQGTALAANFPEGGDPGPPGEFTAAPVRYADGVVKLTRTDLASDGIGAAWGQSRSWTNGPGYAAGSTVGDRWVTTQAPRLIRASGTDVLAAVGDGTTAWYFDKQLDGTYKVRHFGAEALTYDDVADTYTMTTAGGDVIVFNGFTSPAWAPAQRGQFRSYTTAGGVTTEVTDLGVGGRITETAATAGGVTETYEYEYVTTGGTGGTEGRLSKVTRKLDAVTVGSVEYSYYDGTTADGLAGDLESVAVKDAAGAVTSADYYRYYTTGESAGLLKYAVLGAAVDRLVAAAGSVDSATDTQVAAYADHYFEYAGGRVTKEVASGQGCSACAGGQGTFVNEYTDSGNAPGYNAWATKTVETLPDGSVNTVYTNAYGDVMLRVHQDAGATQTWADYYRYDGAGRLVLHASPSAVTGWDEYYDDLVHFDGGDAEYLADAAGLLTVYSYYDSTTATDTTAGGAAGYQDAVALRHGEAGDDVPQQHWAYFARAAGDYTAYPVASRTVYRNDDGTGGETTSYSYAWYSGTTHAYSVTTTLPTVTTGQNGPNSATAVATVFDAQGRPVWAKDAAGFLTYTAYDLATGAVVKTITDVNTANTSDFSGLPSGWSTPSGGGLHLISTYEVDSLGRTTKATSPGGMVAYTVYDDANHEVRSYTWDAVNGVRVGPTTVVREDRAGGYTETLTMSATPATSSGVPTGTESISGVLSLSRSYRNDAGQVTHSDAYFDLSGVTYSTAADIGTLNTNYYRTTYAYGKLGQQNKVVSPAGTITRTEFDAMGRAASVWVGTDDTPSSGNWSTTNLTGTNMVKVAEYEYDGGDDGGDGNLTTVTQFPGLSAPARVTETYYDWRGRAVATKAGVETTESTSVNRPITYTDYDNLGEVVETRLYDGDGVTVTTTDGVPDAPSSSLLRAQTVYAYDELGRAYRTSVYSVDPTSGSVSSSALTTDVWYDARGNVVKTASPGGLVTKTSYDGAGRVTVTYATDGGGDSGYSDADDVTGDTVLSQGEYAYDADGDVILVAARERFHDATGTGALGSPSSSQPKARVSYAASYYDAAGRLTASVDVGTNGASSYTRPGSVPSRSDTVLVTGYDYDSAGRLWKVTDPKAIENRTEYDALGRTTKTVQNYVDGTVSDTDDKTTVYAYGPAGLTSLTAQVTGGGGQTTGYVYGVTTGGGSGVNSNDVQAITKWPDPSTGAASTSEEDVVTVNALGQVLTRTDRNGSTHAYTYDVLGRLTVDAVTTLGSLTPALDGTVARIEYGYDALGNLALVTSYNAVSGGTIVNEVKRAYNGLGQLVSECQAHGGAVNTSTSPKVAYAYGEMPSGANHSRLTSITYPGGYVLTYTYASGLDANISRLSSLSDSGGTLESYDYLGLGTVVDRHHPQPGVDLSYVKLSGESVGDAGDQYTGLDRFGRVVDQRWLDSSSGTAKARLQYGYDRDSNRLYRDDLMSASAGELYSYDGLGQVASFDRGTLNGGKTAISGSASRTLDWDYDALGNFAGVDLNGTTTTRTHDAQNEVTGVGGATLTYDPNGNMTTDETGRKFVYDAWNRLVQVKSSGGTLLETFAYDGLGRRISVTPNGGSTTDLYYSAGWQVIEERVSGTTSARYVWSPVYVDALILRDRDTDANGSLDERLYALTDANWNVVALVNTSGTVVERYEYDPFGAVTVLDGSYGSRGTSSYAWTVGFQGMFWDNVSGTYRSRGRTDYSPTLGRWATVDPMGFAAGDVNQYRMEGNNLTGTLDPSGLAVCFTSISINDKGSSLPATPFPGIDPFFKTMGPRSNATDVSYGFQVDIRATIGGGDEITDANVKQEVTRISILSDGKDSPIMGKGTMGNGKLKEATLDPWLDGFVDASSGIRNGKPSAFWGNLVQDGQLHTGPGGIFQKNVNNGIVTTTPTSIVWFDSPGFAAVQKTPLPQIATQVIYMAGFRITATDKGGPSNGKSIVAEFLLFIAADNNGKTWVVNQKRTGTIPVLPKTWTNKT